MADETKPPSSAPLRRYGGQARRTQRTRCTCRAPAARRHALHLLRAAAHLSHPSRRAAHRGASTAAVDLAGKTTTAAATAAKVSSRDPDDSSPLVTRRVWLGMAWGAFSAASAAALAATGRFMFPNVLNEPPQQFKVGCRADFGMGVDERYKESNGVWIVRTNDDIVHHASGFYVLNTTCTHLGCTPNFLAAEVEVQVPVPRQRLPADRHQLRGPGAAAARAQPHRARRRRPDPRSTRAGSSSTSWASGSIPNAFLQTEI